MNDLVIDSVQFVYPLVLVHSVSAPASDPYGFFEPACGFVWFLVDDFSCVATDHVDAMVIGCDMLNRQKTQTKKRRKRHSWGPLKLRLPQMGYRQGER